MTATLAGKTLFISGGSRGIGKAIALRAARDGANIVIAAKTAQPHPKLPGTVASAVAEVIAAGGKGLGIICDIRAEDQVQSAVDQAVAHFGGIDILVNNASAISLTDTPSTPMKRFDLMMSVNMRGTFLCSQTCLAHLKKSANPHILTLSPPIDMTPYWFAPHVAYTMSKYGMSMCVLGMAEEFRKDGIAVNALWPRTVIATDAVNMIPGIDLDRCRRAEIVADAAHAVLVQDSRAITGRFLIDEDVLTAAGIKDFTPYAVNPAFAGKQHRDLFLR